MKIEIKNYKSCAGDEGDAFSCTLYLDGKRAALVRYAGTGGPFDFDFTVAGAGNGPWCGPLYDAFKAYIDSLPEVECEWDDPKTGKPASLKRTMDWVVGDVVNETVETRKLKRLCKKNTVWREQGDPKGQWHTVAVPWGTEGRRWLEQNAGDVEEVANERFATKETA